MNGFTNDVIHQQFFRISLCNPRIIIYISIIIIFFLGWFGLVCMFCVFMLSFGVSLYFFFSYLSFAKIIYAFANINLPDGFFSCCIHLPQISRYWYSSLVGGRLILQNYEEYLQIHAAPCTQYENENHYIKRQSTFPFSMFIFLRSFLICVYMTRHSLFGPCNLNNVLHFKEA